MLFPRSALALLCAAPLVILAANPPVVKQVPAQQTSPASGTEMFKSYCASCHGADAKGHGPAALAMQIPPPDLTLLAKNNHGKFPDRRVYTSIRGDVNSGAHGSAACPYGEISFRKWPTPAATTVNRPCASPLSAAISNRCSRSSCTHAALDEAVSSPGRLK